MDDMRTDKGPFLAENALKNNEGNCLMVYFQPKCEGFDCRKCSIAMNSSFGSHFLQPYYDSVSEAHKAENERIMAENQENIDKVCSEMLAQKPANKWTQSMVKSYCFDQKIPAKNAEIIYGKIKRNG